MSYCKKSFVLLPQNNCNIWLSCKCFFVFSMLSLCCISLVLPTIYSTIALSTLHDLENCFVTGAFFTAINIYYSCVGMVQPSTVSKGMGLYDQSIWWFKRQQIVSVGFYKVHLLDSMLELEFNLAHRYCIQRNKSCAQHCAVVMWWCDVYVLYCVTVRYSVIYNVWYDVVCRYDLVDVTREALQLISTAFYSGMIDSFHTHDYDAMK